MANQGWTGEAKVSGQKRQKVFGYLKAANELRQSYTQGLSEKWQERGYDDGVPGGFPEGDIVRSGEEEMLLFPSYARPHARATHPSQDINGTGSMPGTRDNVDSSQAGDANYWRRQWEDYEDANAVVDVDVRGWIFVPQKGPLSRRNRLLVAVARRLSGIPAPDASPSHSRESSQAPNWRNRAHDDVTQYEEEMAAREAETIERRGQREVEAANRGKYAADQQSLIDFSPTTSRSSSPTRGSTKPNVFAEDTTTQSLTPPSKRQSWNLSGQMSRDEIIASNELLMTRLRPFMSTPLANTALTIFFYNEHKSVSKSVFTDDSGHFKLRAALEFVPDKVRVLASDTLSTTEDVLITDSQGISIVSDIDDTIKHSAIASGAKEIFKNTFIRELGELTVPGVREWYSKMSQMGVTLHYVSNSPWQLYPLLKSYFTLAGLPPGSFHLKQYSGMLQGIFEPAAERKKGSLDRIMHDFPERKFILIGDSGEADLEVYTDIVQEHPGRVLAIFIRDVTSKGSDALKEFFYGSQPRDNDQIQQTPTSARDQRTENEWAPNLPERPKHQKARSDDLIDFTAQQTPSQSTSYSNDLQELQGNGKRPPTKPNKPSNLRSTSTASSPPRETAMDVSNGSIDRQLSINSERQGPPAPPPPRRSATSTSSITSSGASTPTGERYYASQNRMNPAPPPMSREQRTLWQDSGHSVPRNNNSPSSEGGYLASARQHISTVYNALPAIRPQNSGGSQTSSRGLSSYPAAAARFVTGSTGGDPNAGGDGGAPGQPYDKKLEMWKRRWTRSEEIMKQHGVVLKTWTNGTDVMGLCERLVRQELKRAGLPRQK